MFCNYILDIRRSFRRHHLQFPTMHRHIYSILFSKRHLFAPTVNVVFDFILTLNMFTADDDDDLSFDFLINNCLLRVTLREYVEQNALPTVYSFFKEQNVFPFRNRLFESNVSIVSQHRRRILISRTTIGLPMLRRQKNCLFF